MAFTSEERELLSARERAGPVRAFLRRHAEAVDRRLRIALELEGRSALARSAAFAALFARAIAALARELEALPPEGPVGFESLEAWLLRRASAFAAEWTAQPLDGLVATYGASTDEEDRALVRGELRTRLLGPIDGVIRDTLRARQLGYEADAGHFNAIFEFVLTRIFDPDSFDRRLASYDATKGSFEGWFLFGGGSVVRNEVRMWLRERSDEAQGVKKEDEARAGAERAEQAFDLDDRESGVEGVLARGEVAAERQATAAAADRARSRRILDALKPEHRVVLRTLMIAYQDLDGPDLEAVADSRGVSADQARKEAEALRAELCGTDAFREDAEVDLRLGALTEQVGLLERRRYGCERRLEAGGLDGRTRETLAEAALGFQLREIGEIRRGASPPPAAWADHHARLGSTLWDWAECIVRGATARERLERLQREVRAGRTFVRPSHQQLAAFLGLAPGTVASRLNRAKGELDRLLTDGRIPGQTA